MYEPIPDEVERIGSIVVDAAVKIHRDLGPGMLEKVYELCLCHELTRLGLKWRRQVKLPIVYEGLVIEDAYELDVLIEELVITEIKSVRAIEDVHIAQCLTHLKFAHKRLGRSLNFNVPVMRKGIKRIVL